MKWILVTVLALAVGCGGDETPSDTNNGSNGQTVSSTVGDAADMGAMTSDAGDGDVGTADASTSDPIDRGPLQVMDRPVDVVVPQQYDSSKEYPLLLMLHGYSANNALQDLYFGTSQVVDERDYILVMPEGLENPESKRYWNAYWCCDSYQSGVDDVAYLTAVIEEAKTRFSIDPKRVYFLGHSNGGFMSYRMACDVDGIAAIASLAGSGPEDPADCGDRQVSVLQVHGTNDSIIRYDGTAGQHPSAPEMTRRWAERNGCDTDPAAAGRLNLVDILPGDETFVERWENCEAGTTVELWTIDAGAHIPGPNERFKSGMLDFLFDKQLP